MTADASTLGIFGGSFDPPHVGHLLTACYALSTGEIDELWVVPTFVHPFDKPLNPFAHRLAMCELAFADLRRCSVQPLERELGTVSYTRDMLEAVAARGPGRQLRLLLGTDLLEQTSRWRDFEYVRKLAPPLFVRRGGHPHALMPESTPSMPEVSSSDVRARLAEGTSVHGLVPRQVADYAHTHNLYGRHA